MTDARLSETAAAVTRMAGLLRSGQGLLSLVAGVVAPPVLRVALALPFFRSGLTRWDGFLSLSDSTVYLFAEEFKLHILGGEYDIPMPNVVAFVTAMAEITLPILLIVGFATRLSALGLLLMTGVIQLVIPDGWANFHLYWGAIALAIITLGPGSLSIDHLISVWFPANATGSGRG